MITTPIGFNMRSHLIVVVASALRTVTIVPFRVILQAYNPEPQSLKP